MSRPRYEITADDFPHAQAYLAGRLRSYELPAGDDSGEARQEFWDALQQRGKAKRVSLLNRWCEHWLSSTEWTRLKTAVRQRRRRWEKYDEVRTVTISKRAHKILSRLAKRDSVTLSEVIERRLGRTLNQARR